AHRPSRSVGALPTGKPEGAGAIASNGASWPSWTFSRAGYSKSGTGLRPKEFGDRWPIDYRITHPARMLNVGRHMDGLRRNNVCVRVRSQKAAVPAGGDT